MIMQAQELQKEQGMIRIMILNNVGKGQFVKRSIVPPIHQKIYFLWYVSSK